MNPNPKGSAQSPAAPSGSPSAESPAVDPLSKLLQMQTAMAQGEHATAEESPVAPAKGAPEDGEQAAEAVPGEGAAAESAGAEQTDLSQEVPLEETDEERESREAAEAEAAAGGAPEGALPAELAELPDDVRAELFALAKEVADGTTSFGELKRGHKLIGKHAEEVERLQGEIETLKGQLEQGPARGDARPTEFKNLNEVVTREQQLEKVIDWCDDNPEGGEFNGQTFSVDDVKAARRKARDEIKYVLPGAKQQLQAQATFTKSQQQVRPQVLQQFPELKDPGHATTRAVNEMLTKVPMLKSMFVSPELAAMTWIEGEKVMKARAAAKKPGAKPTVQPKPGEIQRRKPVVGGGGGAARNTGGPSVAKAKEQIAREGSVGALANLMEAMEPPK